MCCEEYRWVWPMIICLFLWSAKFISCMYYGGEKEKKKLKRKFTEEKYKQWWIQGSSQGNKTSNKLLFSPLFEQCALLMHDVRLEEDYFLAPVRECLMCSKTDNTGKFGVFSSCNCTFLALSFGWLMFCVSFPEWKTFFFPSLKLEQEEMLNRVKIPHWWLRKMLVFIFSV